MMADSLVHGTVNFRDTGGLPVAGSATRHGVLFRSGNLATVTPEGETDLAALGLKRIIDLRDDEEVRKQPSRAGDIPIQRVPLFAGSVASFFTENLGLTDMYRTLVDDSADRVVDVVRGVLADQPVLVHCTVGKDRTGVTVALTLAAAGVDERAIIADYARTESLLPAERNRAVIELVRKVHPESQNIVELATQSPARIMQGLFTDLTNRFGSPTDYLRAQGLSDDEIAGLVDVLVDRGTRILR